MNHNSGELNTSTGFASPVYLATVNHGPHSVPQSETTALDYASPQDIIAWNLVNATEELVVASHSVLWFECGVLKRKFGFPGDIVTHALFTHFDDPEPASSKHVAAAAASTDASQKKKGYGKLKKSKRLIKRNRAIVVVLKEFAHIFFVNGSRFVVNIPFEVGNVFSTERGLILQRKITELNEFQYGNISDDLLAPSAKSNLPQFFSLTDAMADLGQVIRHIPATVSGATTNVSGFLHSEELIYVSNRQIEGQQHAVLGATYDNITKSIHVYQFRYLSADGNLPAKRRTMSRRRSSMLQSMTEDTIASLDLSSIPGNTRRVSSSRADTSLTIDRMGAGGIDASEIIQSGSGFGGLSAPFVSWWYDIESLKKEIEFTHIESFPIEVTNKNQIKCFNIVNKDLKLQVLGLMNKDAQRLLVLIFSLEGATLRFQDSIKLTVMDAVPIANSSSTDDQLTKQSQIMVLQLDQTIKLFNPFLRLYSPQIHAPDDVVSLEYAVNNKVSLRLSDQSLQRIEIVQVPESFYVSKSIQVINSILDLTRQERLNFYFSAALQRSSQTKISKEWDALIVAIFASWIGPGQQNITVEKDTPDNAWKQLIMLSSENLDCRNDSFDQAFFDQFKNNKWYFEQEINKAIKLANDISSIPDIVSDWTQHRPFTVCALHLLVEELKLDIAASEAKHNLELVIGQLVRWLGWSDEWNNSYSIWNIVYDEVPRFTSPMILSSPVNILSVFYHLLITPPDLQTMKMPTLYDVYSQQHISQSTSSSTKKSLATVLPRSKFICEIFDIIKTAASENVYREILEKLLDSLSLLSQGSQLCFERQDLSKGRLLLNEIERLPEGILLLFKEAIVSCQENTPTDWDVDALELIGRRDLKKLVELGNGLTEVEIFKPTIFRDRPREMNQIMQSVLTEADSLGPWDGVSELDRVHVSRQLFREDRRMHEAQKLLQTTKMQSGKFDYGLLSTTYNEADMHTAQTELARVIGLRTLAVPVGRGGFFYSARVPLLTEKFPIPKMNFNVMMKPSMTTITAEKHLMSEPNICWGLFHNGVASGLSVSKDAKEITGSWIVFNKPNELSSQHAGFLLGLGLNGHLKHLAEWHIYNYLRPKHTLTSVALLIGMSASFLGSMNPKMTKVLSVHVVALLPAGSADLNISGSMQTAGIMGVGLLYYKTYHRRMSEILVAEIDQFNASGIRTGGAKNNNAFRYNARQAAANANNQYADAAGTGSQGELNDRLHDEGYLLAAGFALGLINIGSGPKLQTLNDLNLMERLLAIGTGNTGSNSSTHLGSVGSGVSGGAFAQLHHILDKSAAGCIMGLLLIYLKSENASMAQKIDVPETEILFEYVRPDLLLLRTFASRLIMWSNIGSTREWIANSIRPFLRDRVSLQNITTLDSDDLPLINIVCGLCFSMAIRYAGTGDTDAISTLIYYLDQFIRLNSLPANSHDERTTKSTVRSCQSSLALSCAVVMAGTGDLRVLRRLRRLHGTVGASVTYGAHLATHLAIGLLFAGGGEYSFNVSNDSNSASRNEKKIDDSLLRIAGLVIALYPQYPNDVLDNQVHLQAFRHFWTFAIQKRCLIVRDIETTRPIVMPVSIGYKMSDGKVKTEKLTAPCLIPPLSSLLWLKTESADHWPVYLDLEKNIAHARALKHSLTVYADSRRGVVQRRSDDGSLPFGAVLRGLGGPDISDKWAGDDTTRVDDHDRARGLAVTSTVPGISNSMQKLLAVGLQGELDHAEKAIVIPADVHTRTPQVNSVSTDLAGTLANFIENPKNKDDLWNVRVGLFGVPRWVSGEGSSPTWSQKQLAFVPQETVEKLKVGVWRMRQPPEAAIKTASG
ncbi:hypothetical protein V1514DRAFT_338485 [Lipomyces japonicus]|uniref:uncharacterized protein n=1 Tax=Lipomyces japonicus TaxID=56871 RepID=UPI0034CFB3D9